MTDTATTKTTTALLRKGTLVRVSYEAWTRNPETGTGDVTATHYIFRGPGEILALRGNYGQIRWHRPVPDVWLCLDYLEPFAEK